MPDNVYRFTFRHGRKEYFVAHQSQYVLFFLFFCNHVNVAYLRNAKIENILLNIAQKSMFYVQKWIFVKF